MSVTECSFPFFSLLGPHEVVAILKIDFIEEFCTLNSFLKLIHIGEGVTIRNGDLIDCSIVNAQAWAPTMAF